MTTAVLASPRMRRRLAWLAALLAVAGGIAALVLLVPGRPSVAGSPITRTPAQVVTVPKTVPPPRAALNALLDRFIPDVIAGKDLLAGWKLVTPDARGSYDDWQSGVTPFQHFAAKGRTFHGWRVNYSYPGDVGFDIFVSPVKKTMISMAFRGEAKKVGGTWRIAVFYPQATFQPPGKRQLVYTEQDMKPNLAAQPESGRLAPWVLAVPFAALGGIVLLGVAVMAVKATRRRARVRAIERELAAERL